MRLLAIASFVAFFLVLLGARFLPEPLWRLALYLVPFFFTLFVVGLAAALLEFLLGPGFRTAAPAVAFALALFCLLYFIFERPPGTLGPGLELDRLWDKAASIAALAAGVGALLLAVFGLRSPSRIAQGIAGASVVMVAVALGGTARALGLPTLSSVSLALIGGAGVLFLLSSAPREAPEPPDADDQAGSGET
ncbi:MAG: hypothetical protein ACK4N5_09010 [Myxococcales bacterium]